MSIQVTVNNSFFNKIKQTEELLEEEAKELAYKIIDTTVNSSPVDTGAYMDSFSIVPRGSSGGRSRTSRGKPRNQPWEPYASAAKSRLRASVAAMTLSENGGFTLVNRAPHARFVEFGNGRGGKAYMVFSKIRERYG